ncbi:MAG: DNA-protecting protein DprA [Pseudomonadales bacterium]|nr:DNA-protecting protein DprA [Pseudomonadales bacterium]
MHDLSDIEALLLLQRVPGIGPKRLRQLMGFFDESAAIWRADVQQLAFLPTAIREEIKAIQHKGRAHAYWQQVCFDLEAIDKNNIQLLTLDDDLYPGLLKETDNAPALLYIKGDTRLLSQAQIAVVGSRKASTQSLRLSYQWAQHLANKGLVITSGLAIGVDGAAHQGAIDAGKPTIAVLAHGMDSLYPARHKKMAEAIAACGVLVSEFPLGTQAKREHFPRRNRIITGLSLALLVTEAAIKSGSMISAQYAIEQNRDVFAIPGNINNPQAAGCHYLIQQGAYLATSADDILQGLNWHTGDINAENYQPSLFDEAQASANNLNVQQQKLVDKIPFEPIHMDELIKNTAIPAALLAGQLLELEILNVVECIGGNYQRIQ